MHKEWVLACVSPRIEIIVRSLLICLGSPGVILIGSEGGCLVSIRTAVLCLHPLIFHILDCEEVVRHLNSSD